MKIIENNSIVIPKNLKDDVINLEPSVCLPIRYFTNLDNVHAKYRHALVEFVKTWFNKDIEDSLPELVLVKPLRYHGMAIENAQEEILSIEFLNELHDFFDKYGIKKGTELHKGLFDICIVYLQSHNIKF